MNIYFSGIGGAGIGALAEIALDAGFNVFGSDLSRSLQTAELEKRGVQIFYEQNQDIIAKVHMQTPIDWLVYTSALPDTAPELEFAKEHNIKFTKRDQFLAEFIKQKQLKMIAIAGTHGKTTTTAMLIWVMKKLQIPMSHSVGTTLSFGASGHFDAQSEFFIYEADEYDRNFLHFSPHISLLPSFDYDHVDIYKNQEEYNDAFRKFIFQSQHTLLWQNSATQLGLGNETKITILDHEVDLKKINLAGQFMRNNAWLVTQTLRKLWPEVARENTHIIDDFNGEKIANILSQFPGASRRFEKLGENIYSDYAHHPVEILATLEKARELSDSVIVVYQPHQNRRQVEIMNGGGYKNAFEKVMKVYWAPTYLNRMDLEKDAPTVLLPSNLIASLTNPEVAEPAELNDALFNKIQDHCANSEMVLVMGAGPIDDWIRQQIAHS